MREIKFRAWDKEFTEEMWIVQSLDFVEDVVSLSKSGYDFEPYTIALTQVELMQYTGLKDKNGKEIYEGDVVKWTSYTLGRGPKDESKRNYKIADVYYLTENGKYVIRGEEIWGMIYSDIEVIGNIYEHSHLLESQGSVQR